MNHHTRHEYTPQEYIRKLFSDTRDSVLPIEYYSFPDGAYTLTHEMTWTAAEAEWLVEQYTVLSAALRHIGELHDALLKEENRKKRLTPEEEAVWNTYIRPFEPFEVEDDVIDVLYFRRETETLDDEENDLIERHYEWFEENSLKRLPFRRCSPNLLINRAQNYEYAIRHGVPEAVINEQGCDLAEQMVLYYFGPQKINQQEESKEVQRMATWKVVYYPQVLNGGMMGVAFIEAETEHKAMYTFQQQYAGQFSTVESCKKVSD